MKNKRVAGLDIIRALAVLFVISVHYFKNTIFYSIPMTGKTMIILNSLRWLFFICVPLFMILTGYLSRNKEPNRIENFDVVFFSHALQFKVHEWKELR